MGIGSHILEEAGHAAEALIKVVTLAEGIGDGLGKGGNVGSLTVDYWRRGKRNSYLEGLFILFCLTAVNLLDGRDILLDVATSMLPCLQTF